jgi:hypothetical protein
VLLLTNVRTLARLEVLYSYNSTVSSINFTVVKINDLCVDTQFTLKHRIQFSFYWATFNVDYSKRGSFALCGVPANLLEGTTQLK